MVQNILLTRRWPQEIETKMTRLAQGRAALNFNNDDLPFTRDQLQEALQTSEILCPTVTDHIDGDMLSAPGVVTKLIANFGVGFNHIDMQVAKAQGIVVTNTPGVLTEATAEIALTLLLSVARRTGEGERLVRAGQWQGWNPTHMMSTQVTGKTLGIVGMGRIGLDMAQKAHFGLGMRIIYNNRSALPDEVADRLSATHVSLDELLASSDFVSLHCPATTETRHLINAEKLAAMQPHSFLINTARGDVVDEVALVDALQQGVIAGAGLDVYEAEPALASGLVGLENVVILPHMGSGTRESRTRMGQCALDNILAFLDQEPLPNLVNVE
ncbi:MAG: lactate dehydrogenase-like 2-hydroxyacid dehydrogenase [Limisphaerales bacterium]|jgi:lactate dehydrogenase-like 2-hydroxyacid dehydrogenase